MKDNPQLMFEIADLTLHALNGTLDKAGLQRLEKLLSEDPTAVDYYQELVWIYAGLKSMEGMSYLQQTDEAMLSVDFWQALLLEEKTAQQVTLPDKEPEQPLIQKVVYPPRPKRKLSKFDLITLINVAAVVLFFVFFRFVPSKAVYEVATLVDSIDAAWSQATPPVRTGSRLTTKQGALVLSEGMVKVLFDHNVQVVIEAPCEFKVTAQDSIQLMYGRLYAIVPPEANGFTVTTASAQIVDLGTEFGVEVDYSGDTALHVIKGKTLLGLDNSSDGATMQVVDAGRAKRVSADSQAIIEIPCDYDRFIRDINSGNHVVWRGEALLQNGSINWKAAFGNWANGANWSTGTKPDGTATINLRAKGGLCTLNTNEGLLNARLVVSNGQTFNIETGGRIGMAWTRIGYGGPAEVTMSGNGTFVLNNDDLYIGEIDGSAVWTMSDTSSIMLADPSRDDDNLYIGKDGNGLLRLIGSGISIRASRLDMGWIRTAGTAPSATIEYVMDGGGAARVVVQRIYRLGEPGSTTHLVLSATSPLPKRDIVLIEATGGFPTGGKGTFDLLNGGPATEGTTLRLGGNRYALTYTYDANGDKRNNDIALVYVNADDSTDPSL